MRFTRLGRRCTDPLVAVAEAADPTRPIGAQERANIASLDAEAQVRNERESLSAVLEALHRAAPGVSLESLSRYASRIRAAHDDRATVAA